MGSEMVPMLPSRVIEAKRDGASIPPKDLEAFLLGFLNDDVPDYQMAAFLMAAHFRGMDRRETDVMVDCMLGSGGTLDLTHLEGPRVDKHSTGGVGDKVSLVLAPLAAELGLFVPMMSGRGLGHTTGTLDKLEAIRGFRTRLGLDEFVRVLSRVGCAMIGQTDEIAPLDRRLYALRDVTATVSIVPVIAASIMSKKLAEGLDGLVLDVKVGSGAFIPEEARALELARAMVSIGPWIALSVGPWETVWRRGRPSAAFGERDRTNSPGSFWKRRRTCWWWQGWRPKRRRVGGKRPRPWPRGGLWTGSDAWWRPRGVTPASWMIRRS
jgi:pyrimidine-nucleoside phosphorylase